MSIRVTLNCQVQKNQFDKLRPFLVENLPRVRGFEGCRRVSVLFNPENSELLLDEEWLNSEAHKNYIEFISNNGILDKLGAFLVAAPEIKYFDKVDI